MTTSEEDGPVIEQEEDAPRSGKVIAIAVFAGVVFAAAILWVIGYLGPATRASDLSRTSLPPELGNTQIGMVYQPLIDEDKPIKKVRAHQREILSSYGWVDRDAGVVHIPVEQAMRTIVETGAAP